jgi:spermidine synthase
VVAYRAPFATYAAEAAPRERLLAVVDAWAPVAAAAMAVPANDQRWEERLSRYRRARNLYLQVGSQVRPVADLHAMLQQVREPLLGVLRVSPEFRPAFGPLWNMAKALEQQDPAAGQALLEELQAIAVEREILSRSL